MAARVLTEGEKEMLATVFSKYIDYKATKVFNEKWMFFQPGDTAMTPNGSMYWNPKHYLADFSSSKVPLSTGPQKSVTTIAARDAVST